LKSGKKKDAELFLEAMADVRPLNNGNRLEPTPKKTPAIARQREKDERSVLQELLEPLADPAELETGEELLFLRSGYQKRIIKRLRRGQYSVGDTIDLHHMNLETAKEVLLDFLQQSCESGHSCVRVIHGKGLRSRDIPKLKIMTNRILRKNPRVVAFASCRPVDGGTGAVEVLLSARRSPR
jgi:DNA-nicking Smr family endonuclease